MKTSICKTCGVSFEPSPKQLNSGGGIYCSRPCQHTGNMNKEAPRMYEVYQQGLSLSQVGKKFGLTRQSVYSDFKRRGYKLRAKKVLPYLVFDEKKFTLSNTGYYALTYGDRQLMQRYVWEFYNGPILKGFDVHHINHDRTDNRIENLEMISRVQHSKLHHPITPGKKSRIKSCNLYNERLCERFGCQLSGRSGCQRKGPLPRRFRKNGN